MIDNAEDLAQKAQDNKAGLKKQYVNIEIGDEEYGFRISGIVFTSSLCEDQTSISGAKPSNKFSSLLILILT